MNLAPFATHDEIVENEVVMHAILMSRKTIGVFIDEHGHVIAVGLRTNKGVFDLKSSVHDGWSEQDEDAEGES